MRLIGNTVLIAPIHAEGFSLESGLFQPNHYKRPTLTFKVLAVGPGEQRRRLTKKGRRILLDIWDRPEVEVGDCILTHAELDHNIVKHSFDDGTGRLIIYSQGILMSWRERE